MPQQISRFSIMSDEELMHEVCIGEVAAFDQLYARYGRRMLSYFTRMLNYNAAVAEDALQDLFLKIAEDPAKFDRSRSFKTWIFTVASNTCKNYYRHAQVKANSKEELRVTLNVPTDTFARIAGKVDGSAFRHMLDEVLGQLPPEKREAFLLKYQEDKTIAEIAAIQQCPEGSVKSRLHYAIRILEEKLSIFNPILT